MEAGELGTFLGGNLLFIDVDDHQEDNCEDSTGLKGMKAYTSSEHSSPGRQNSDGSLSHASFTAADDDAANKRKLSKRKRSTVANCPNVTKQDDIEHEFDSLEALEVESPSSLAASMALHTPQAVDSMITFFRPPPVNLSATSAFEADSLNHCSNNHVVYTPLLPPPPSADGIALGLPCGADMALLSTWGRGMLHAKPTMHHHLHTSSSYYGASFTAGGIATKKAMTTDVASLLQDVLKGNLCAPPIGLKLDIAAVAKELNQVDHK